MASKFRTMFRSKESKESRSQALQSPSTPEPFSGPPQDRPTQLPLVSQTSHGPASIATNSNPSPSAPIGKGQNYGIQVLHSGSGACVDIVFVHGLTGNAYDTWLHKETGIHWPSGLLGQDLPDTRIMSFGYDADVVNLWNPASKSRLSSHGENLVGDLVRERERTDTETRKILFVAHSLGGLVTEYALSHSRHAAEKHLHQIERCTAGIVFIGVPQCGSDLASWAKFGTRLVGMLRPANKDIVGVLDPGSEMLREVQKGFHTILRLRKDEGSEISITCFYEELPVTSIGEIVPFRSAEIKGYSCYGIHANHMDMTTFPNGKDRGYSAISGELLRWKKTIHAAAAIDSRSDRQSPIRWKIPRVSPLYTGRRELGKRLTAVFAFDSSAPPVRQRVFVIIGIGGTGKSEVCAKFANDHEDEYWGIFWLDGRSVMTAEQGMIDIGRTCGIVEPSITSVKSWLACKSQRWLMIIDNADNFKINYSEYMPSSKRGDIILTTRNPECVAYETAGNEPLDGLEPKLAQELLLRATFTPESRWKEKEEAAIAVIRILGSHTLAIVQAGAFVRKKLCSLEEYPIFFQQQKAQLLKFHSEANTSTYGNVYATFEVSAEYLQKSALPEYLDALELLHILAFLHSDGILETLFQRASEYATEVRTSDQTDDEKPFFLSMRHLARLPAYVQREWSSNLQDRMRWRKACAILESLSLIATHEDDSSIGFSMHSLIHAWAKERQDHQSRCLAWQSAASVLGLSCKDVYDFDPFFIYLQSHVQACVGHRVETLTIDISDTEVAQILIQLAYVLYRTQNWSSLSSLVQQIRLRLHDTHKISQETREAVETLNARVCEYEGDYGKAVDLFRDVLEGRARRLPEDDPNRLVSEHELACAYLANGQIGEAVSLLEHVVKFREELAENDPDRLTSQHEFARAYLENGQLDKAIDLLKYVNKIQEQLAENHPSRLASQHELARAYSKDGQIDKAIDLFQYVVKFREQLAEDHPDRLASQHELARAYLAKGQIDEAIDLFEHVVRVKEKKLAEGHPDRLVSQHELAGAYLESGQIDEGIHLFEHVVRITERKLAEDHPSRLASQRGLAHAYLANGQIVEAINLFEQIVRVCDGKLTENHPIRLRSQRELALAYQAKRQVQEE